MITMVCLKADCDDESAKEQKKGEHLEWDPAIEEREFWLRPKVKNPYLNYGKILSSLERKELW